MISERVQRLLERSLDEGFDALEKGDWATLGIQARIAVALDPTSIEAQRLVAVANNVAGAPCNGPAGGHTIVRQLPAGRVTLDEVVEHGYDLVPFPPIATKIIAATDDESAAVADLARLIATDSTLTARVLQRANSAYYARGQRISTIREAVVRLGARELRSLAVASCIVDGVPDGHVIATDAFWRFSVTVALIADLLAYSQGMRSGAAFTAGIVHNIGLLALDLRCPGGLEEARTLAAPGMLRLQDRLNAVLDFTDADVSGALGARWSLPEPIVRAMANYHLRPDELDPHDRVASCVVRARIFARFSGLSDGLEQSAQRPLPREWTEYPLSLSLAQIGGLQGILRRVDAFLGTDRHAVA